MMMQDAHPASQTRQLLWDACYNVRDLGGHPTHHGNRTHWKSFVRADSLHRLRPAGEAALSAYGIRTVIDLRTREETLQAPNPFVERQAQHATNDTAPHTLHIPIIEAGNTRWQTGATQIESLTDMYQLMLDAFGGQFAAVMRAIAEADSGTIAFYCHAGKDRTGLVSALLLDLAEVPTSTIAEDYATSDQYLEPVYVELRRAVADRPAEAASMSWLLQSQPETMLATLEYLQHEYGGAAAYLLAHGLTPTELEAVAQRMVG
jgi:protein-tyrosine phosphatase